ncbi:hypothetical protein AGMMS50255_2250 [Spirochaetia bacterium]|nr:hypothetical protein AGMMS50255_2250 [Spirochaetia bacterium]
MSRYKSAVFKYLHGEFKDLYARGDITAEELREFEQDCFTSSPAASAPRAAHTPAMAAANPVPQAHNIK